MFDYINNRFDMSTPEYHRSFWNSLRCREYDARQLSKGRISATDTYLLPNGDDSKFLKALTRESLFRRIGTVIFALNGDYKIMAKDTDDIAVWRNEGENIPVYDGINDFTILPVDSHKLAGIVRFDEDFVRDASFDFNGHLIQRFARTFGKAEEQGFVCGDGYREPVGLLHPTGGAEIGAETDGLSYDDIIRLFFSVEPEYRDNGKWLMNDETALLLRSLKDESGAYLWNSANDTILGKSVLISNYLPSVEVGATPILFGDFSYYWVVCRRPLSVRLLKERFDVYDQIGYFGNEFLDGRLIRRKAVKGLRITESE